jgi:hypothetical protein
MKSRNKINGAELCRRYGVLAVATLACAVAGCDDDGASSQQTDRPTLEISASGEELAVTGYVYSPTPSEDEPSFVDGWSLQFSRFIVSIKNVQLNEAGTDPTRQDVVGPLVAELAGPWLVDLSQMGNGVGGAQLLGTLNQNLQGNQFDVTTPYAFSYETQVATVEATPVGFVDNDGIAQEMASKGWTLLVEGVANYEGRAATSTVDPTFQGYPTAVRFRLGFGVPAKYINCYNPEIGAEEDPANRGIRFKANQVVNGQLTFHTDHLFWNTLDQEGTPLYFDPIAARVKNFGAVEADGLHDVGNEDLAGVNPTALRDKNNQVVQDRGDQTTLPVLPEVNNPPPAYNPGSAVGVTDLAQFIAYSVRASGHMNADGLCFVQPTGDLIAN